MTRRHMSIFSFARESLSCASFNLRKFTTSSHTMKERIERDGNTDPAKDSSSACDLLM